MASEFDIRLGQEFVVPPQWKREIGVLETKVGGEVVGREAGLFAAEIKDQISQERSSLLSMVRAGSEGRQPEADQIYETASRRLRLMNNATALAEGKLGVWDVNWRDGRFGRIQPEKVLMTRLSNLLRSKVHPEWPAVLPGGVELGRDELHLLVQDKYRLALAYLLTGLVRMGELKAPIERVITRVIRGGSPDEIREESVGGQINILA